MKRLVLFVILLVLCGMSASAATQTYSVYGSYSYARETLCWHNVTYEETFMYHAFTDAAVYVGNAPEAAAASPCNTTTYNRMVQKYGALIKFDTSGIPASAVVTEVRIRLRASSAASGAIDIGGPWAGADPLTATYGSVFNDGTYRTSHVMSTATGGTYFTLDSRIVVKAGVTKVKLSPSGTGRNTIDMASYPPLLEVTYSTGGPRLIVVTSE